MASLGNKLSISPIVRHAGNNDGAKELSIIPEF